MRRFFPRPVGHDHHVQRLDLHRFGDDACLGADEIDWLEKAVAALVFRALVATGGRFRRIEAVEEAEPLVGFHAGALGIFQRALFRAQCRCFKNFQVIRIEHERADGNDVVERLMRGDDDRAASTVEWGFRDTSEQTEFGNQRIDVALFHFRQLDAEPARAITRHHGRLCRHLQKRRRRQGGRGHHVLRQILQHHAYVGHGILVDAGAVPVPIELHFKNIFGGQKGVDMDTRQGHFALADTVEQRLEDVGHLGHVGQAERRRAALDRVGSTEDGVQVFRVGGRDIDAQQQPLFFGEQLLGFIEENLEKLADIDRHGIDPASRVRTGKLIGTLIGRLIGKLNR